MNLINKRPWPDTGPFPPSYGLSSQYGFFSFHFYPITYAPLQNSWKDNSEMFLTFFYLYQPSGSAVKEDVKRKFWLRFGSLN